MPQHSSVARPNRLQRSELAVPATSEKFFEKAATGVADFVFIDLEDAVAPDRKDVARERAVQALNDINWGAKVMAVRVNDLETSWAVRDIIDMVSRCPRLDLLLLPKADLGESVRFVDRLITAIERERGGDKRIGIEVLIETARGVAHVEEIAASCDRLEAMIFGVGDYTVDMRTFDTVFGTPSPRYAVPGAADTGGRRAQHLNDQWHFALARIANACRAYGLRPIDGPFTDFADPEGYRASARRAAALGFEGKWAIHPSQVAIANEVFSPSADLVAWAREVGTAIRRSAAEGRGAIQVNGVLVDMAHAKMADSVLLRAAAVARADGTLPA